MSGHLTEVVVWTGLTVLWKWSENFYGCNPWLFLVQITYKSKFQWKVKSELATYVSYSFYYPSFSLWSLFSLLVDVQLKQLNPLCEAYPPLIFLKVKWWQNIGKTMSISTLWIKRCKLAYTVTVLCPFMHAKVFYVHANTCTQVLNLLSPVDFAVGELFPRVETCGEVILSIWTFLKSKNNALEMLNIN